MTDHMIKVLLVDDEPDILEFLHYNLSRNGFETVQASNGLDAIKMANDEVPDLILLDIMMPGMDGYEACRRLRQQQWAENTHVIAMTGWGQDEDKQRSRQAGFDRHLVKPVDPDDLEKLLMSLKNGASRTQLA